MSTLPWRRRKKGHGRPRSNSAPANISLNVKKQKQWTNEVMQAAVDAVREDHMSVHVLHNCTTYQKQHYMAESQAKS